MPPCPAPCRRRRNERCPAHDQAAGQDLTTCVVSVLEVPRGTVRVVDGAVNRRFGARLRRRRRGQIHLDGLRRPSACRRPLRVLPSAGSLRYCSHSCPRSPDLTERSNACRIAGTGPDFTAGPNGPANRAASSGALLWSVKTPGPALLFSAVSLRPSSCGTQAIGRTFAKDSAGSGQIFGACGYVDKLRRAVGSSCTSRELRGSAPIWVNCG
jgi:hypothetical protein